MGRKTYEGTGILPGMEDDSKPEPSARARSAAPRRMALSIPKIVRAALFVTVFLIASFYGFHRLEQFLISDPRFALDGPDGSRETPTLQIVGVSHASERDIQNVFADDTGRSVYLLPLADRRASMRSVGWVKDASITRLWPNRVVVHIDERQPVAFLSLSSSRFALIDEDGVILPQAKGKFELPVLSGVHTNDPVADRRDRVHRMLRLLNDLGDGAAKLSEIDVTDRDDVKVMQPYEGRVITLLLGDHNFALRYQNFVTHYGEIKQRLPGAATLDLRLEDRITVVE